jgi:hypothetical protein
LNIQTAAKPFGRLALAVLVGTAKPNATIINREGVEHAFTLAAVVANITAIWCCIRSTGVALRGPGGRFAGLVRINGGRGAAFSQRNIEMARY